MGAVAKVKSIVTGKSEVEAIELKIAQKNEELAATRREAAEAMAAADAADDFDTSQQNGELHLRLEWKARRLAHELSKLGSSLAAARAEQRRARWASLASEVQPAARKLIAAARKLARLNAAYIDVRERMQREGFEREAAAYVAIPPHVNGNFLAAPDLIDKFADEVARVSATPSAAFIAAPPPAPQASAAPAPIVPRSRGDHLAPPPSLASAPPAHAQNRVAPPAPPAPRQRQPDDMSPLLPGQVRARVVVAGYPDAAGIGCDGGRLIVLDAQTAKAAAMNGAVEIAEMAPAEKVTA